MKLNLNYENTSDALNIFINDMLFDPGTNTVIPLMHGLY